MAAGQHLVRNPQELLPACRALSLDAVSQAVGELVPGPLGPSAVAGLLLGSGWSAMQLPHVVSHQSPFLLPSALVSRDLPFGGDVGPGLAALQRVFLL